jgi:hypothetical protein
VKHSCGLIISSSVSVLPGKSAHEGHVTRLTKTGGNLVAAAVSVRA